MKHIFKKGALVYMKSNFPGGFQYEAVIVGIMGNNVNKYILRIPNASTDAPVKISPNDDIKVHKNRITLR